MTSTNNCTDHDQQQRAVEESDHRDVVDEVEIGPTKETGDLVAPAAPVVKLVKGKVMTRSESADDLAAAAGTGSPSREELGGRERMKRHRKEVAGRVWIPERWGQEELLKDWTDCSGFEASLMNNTVMSARAALIEEGRRANSRGLRMERSY